MICIFTKGTTKHVIGSPRSASWFTPGDEDCPDAVYDTDEAFKAKWKALLADGFELVRYETSPPKKKRKKNAKYVVKVTGKPDALLAGFATWLKDQVYGSVGYFELIKIGRAHV